MNPIFVALPPEAPEGPHPGRPPTLLNLVDVLEVRWLPEHRGGDLQIFTAQGKHHVRGEEGRRLWERLQGLVLGAPTSSPQAAAEEDALPEDHLQAIAAIHRRCRLSEDADHDTPAHVHRGELLREVRRLQGQVFQAEKRVRQAEDRGQALLFQQARELETAAQARTAPAVLPTELQGLRAELVDLATVAKSGTDEELRELLAKFEQRRAAAATTARLQAEALTASLLGELRSFEVAFDAAFTRLDRQGGNNGFVGLVELRAAVPVGREAFDAGLRALRQARRYSLMGGHGPEALTPEEQAAAIVEQGETKLRVTRRSPVEGGR